MHAPTETVFEAPTPTRGVATGLQAETLIRARPVLVVGSGGGARRYATMLRAEGALVHWQCSPTEALTPPEGVTASDLPLTRATVAGYALVVAAGNTALGNRIALGLARRARVPSACSDAPDQGTVVLVGNRHFGGVKVVVTAEDDAVAEDVRTRLVGALPADYGAVADWVARHRSRVAGTVRQPSARRRFWRDLLDGDVVERIVSGRVDEADIRLTRALRGGAGGRGEIYLIGAGPGEPDLMTLRALRLLRQADVVLYDRLVSQEILALARADARLLDVGKASARHTVPQAEINRRLLEYGGAGLRVARLKGGDPFLFGRGGEEIESLLEAGLPFQVVPGVTAASGCAAYAGIPLTHRDHAQSCVFVTGHRRADGQLDLDFDALAAAGQTVVFYMGLATIEALVSGLLTHGAPAQRPAAIIEQGTMRQQRVLCTSLAQLPATAAEAAVAAPALIIVGDVVTLRDRLAWFGGEGADAPSAPAPVASAGAGAQG